MTHRHFLLGPDRLFQAKVDVLTFLKTYADKSVNMHLRDHLRTGVWSEAIGKGIMDFEAVSRRLKQSGLKISRQMIRKQVGV